MNMTIHLLKKDIFRHRVLLGFYAILILLQLVLMLMEFFTSSISRPSQIVFIGQACVLLSLIPLLVHGDPLLGTTAFWFARPISRTTLLVEKGLFIALFLFVPFLLVIILDYTCENISIFNPDFGFIVLVLLYLVLVIWGLATLTSNLARFAIAAGAFVGWWSILGTMNVFFKLLTGNAFVFNLISYLKLK